MTDTITLPRSVVEQALDALYQATAYTGSESWSPSMTEECLTAATHLCAALEQSQGEQEPVAKVVLTEKLGLPCLQWLDLDRQFDFKGGEFLYTHPQNLNCKSNQRRLATLWGYVKEQPKREPLTPLTDEQIKAIINTIDRDEQYIQPALRQLARAVEAAHGIKEQK